ncbi:hypothetical protein SAMN05518849_10585 [Sphingobium sp. AP50]|uniref:hypothetical protein n=1 Tax=Sphingobium sp. AP50 TaxID=1884369 RepID=UPI0008BF7AFB|nr:hypothetical protein [Sphingobium sp. AP50]SEJ33231.1 hypothetical protein SAMN05518849_10585 [Sphingobium sp. AP50]
MAVIYSATGLVVLFLSIAQAQGACLPDAEIAARIGPQIQSGAATVKVGDLANKPLCSGLTLAATIQKMHDAAFPAEAADRARIEEARRVAAIQQEETLKAAALKAQEAPPTTRTENQSPTVVASASEPKPPAKPAELVGFRGATYQAAAAQPTKTVSDKRAASVVSARFPNNIDIANLFVRYHTKYNLLSNATFSDGESAISMPLFGIIMYIRRNVTNIKCATLKSGSVKCNYRYNYETVPNGTIAQLALLTTEKSGFSDTSDTFAKVNGQWTSETIRAWTQKVAAEASARQPAGSGSSTPCVVTGGVAADWTGGNGMISGVTWDPNIRTPC